MKRSSPLRRSPMTRKISGGLLGFVFQERPRFDAEGNCEGRDFDPLQWFPCHDPVCCGLRNPRVEGELVSGRPSLPVHMPFDVVANHRANSSVSRYQLTSANTSVSIPASLETVRRMVRIDGVAIDMPNAERGFHRYSHNDRADMAASFRLGYQQRRSVGETFWTHPFCPGVCYPTRIAALRAAISTLGNGAE
jgi:hypothetical protein